MKVSTVEQMRILDREAAETFGIKPELLMENAGMAAFSVLADNVTVEDSCFAVICGSGNNGGDGLVIARQIHARGGQVQIALAGDPAKFRGAAALNYKICLKLGIPAVQIADAESLDEILFSCDAVVDALLGTGLTKTVRGSYAEIIDQINFSGLPVLSVDIPSGVNGNSGQVMGTAVDADLTVSFGLPKQGNLLYPGYGLGGDLYVSPISFPPELTDTAETLTEVNLPPSLPLRSDSGHKGTFGDVLFIAGAAGYLGAPYFAAMSFLKAGGGYARLAAPASAVPVLGSGGSEIVFLPQKETKSGCIAHANVSGLKKRAAACDMTVMGPGLSLDDEVRSLLIDLLPHIEKPVLIDGDGLTLISGSKEAVQKRRAPTILTPHPGEMAALTGRTRDEIFADPVSLLRSTAADWQAVIVLKGAHSLIGMPDGRVFINMSGNSGMASAGSGDVLTGTIAAMYGLGTGSEQAVLTGVFMHGFAGDLAASLSGEDGMTARDIMETLPEALRLYRGEYESVTAGYYGKIELV